VHPVEFAADVAPGVVGGILDHPQAQQSEPTPLDVHSEPVLGASGTPGEAEPVNLFGAVDFSYY